MHCISKLSKNLIFLSNCQIIKLGPTDRILIIFWNKIYACFLKINFLWQLLSRLSDRTIIFFENDVSEIFAMFHIFIESVPHRSQLLILTVKKLYTHPIIKFIICASFSTNARLKLVVVLFVHCYKYSINMVIVYKSHTPLWI